jgi:hypothetical protein
MERESFSSRLTLFPFPSAEYKGHACAADATKALQDDLRVIVERRYSSEEYEGFDESYTVQVRKARFFSPPLLFTT